MTHPRPLADRNPWPAMRGGCLAFWLALLLCGQSWGQDTPDILGLPLNDTSGTIATATVGSNGTYARDASNTYTAKVWGTALTGAQDFVAASQDRVAITGVTRASGAAATYVLRVRFDGAISNRGLWGLDSGSNAHRILVSNTTTISISGTSGTSTFTIGALSTGVDYLVAVTFDTSNNVRVYVGDGSSITESSTGAVTIAQSFAPTAIGRSNANYHDGLVADARVFGSTKNAAALLAIMNEKDTAGGGSSIYPQIIISQLDSRLRYQKSHLDLYGVYALAL